MGGRPPVSEAVRVDALLDAGLPREPVYRDAGARATVTMLSGPQVVARRDGPAMAVGDVPLPLVHDTTTMPFYPRDPLKA